MAAPISLREDFDGPRLRGKRRLDTVLAACGE
jgi:hypothetical protein